MMDYPKLRIIMLILIIITNLTILANSTKAKKGKMQKIGENEERSEKNGQKEQQIHYPEKGEMEDEGQGKDGGDGPETRTRIEDIELMEAFKQFFGLDDDGGQVSGVAKLQLMPKSAIWFLRRKTDELLDWEPEKMWAGGKVEMKELAEKMAELRREKAILEQKMGNKSGRMREVVCWMYKMAEKVMKTGIGYAQVMQEWAEKLVDNGMVGVVEVEDVSCDSDGAIDAVYMKVLSPSRICVINGHNIADLLRLFPNFRHFFCHKVNIHKAKLTLGRVISAAQMVRLESEFPEIMRIDIMIESVMIERCGQLLRNRSSSEQYHRQFMQLAMALLIGDLTNRKWLIENGKKLKWIGAGTTRALGAKLEQMIREGQRNLMSEQKMCEMIKMLNLLNSVENGRGNAHKISEKTLKRRSGAEECANGAERQHIIERFRRDELGGVYTKVLSTVTTGSVEGHRELLAWPGAKTRLAQLLGGNKERLGQLMAANKRVRDAYEKRDVFMDDDWLWDHYANTLSDQLGERDQDRAWYRSCKLGADTVVFMRWFHDQLKGQNMDNFGEQWAQIGTYVDNQIYDPMFDQEEGPELDGTDQFLGGMFAETRKFVEKKKKGDGRNSVFERWRGIVERLRKMKMVEKAEKYGEQIRTDQWIKQLHEKEFDRMLRNGYVDKFMSIIAITGHTRLIERMLQFFDGPNIAEILRNFRINLKTEIRVSAKNGEDVEKDGVKNEGSESEDQKLGKEFENDGQKIVEIIEEKKVVGQTEEHKNQYTHFECPPKKMPIEEIRVEDLRNNPDPWDRELNQAYLVYLNSNDEEEHMFRMGDGTHILQVKLLGMLLWLRRLGQELVDAAKRMEPEGTKFGREAKKAEQYWRQRVLQQEMIKPDRLVMLYKFIGRMVASRVLSENSARWCKYVEKKFRIIEWNQNGPSVEFGEKWLEPELGETEAKRIYLILAEDDDQRLNREINLCYITELIKHFQEMRRYFCSLPNGEKIWRTKERLNELIGSENLVMLDEIFPEVLQIDVPVLLTQSQLYQYFLEHRTWSAQYILRGLRLALPILLQLANESLAKLSTAVFRYIFNEFRAKMREIRHQLFLAFGQDEYLMWATCVVKGWIRYMDTSRSLAEEQGTVIRAESVANWKGQKKCEMQEEQMRAYHELKDQMACIHYNQLMEILKNDIGTLKQFMRETRGARSRVRKLIVSGENWESVCKRAKDRQNKMNALGYPIGDLSGYETMMRCYRHELTDPEVFADQPLMRNFVVALLDTDRSARVIGTLSVFIASWVRWMDAELAPDNPARTIGLKQVQEQMWSYSGRAQFEELYDELADADQDEELGRMSRMMKALFAESKKYMEEKRGERRRKGKKQRERKGEEEGEGSLMVEWRRRMAEVGRKALLEEIRDGAEEGGEEGEEGKELEQFRNKLHREELIKLARHSQFRRQLREGFKGQVGSKDRLAIFISGEMIEEILDLLNCGEDKEYEAKMNLMKEQKKREAEKEKKVRECDEAKRKELADQNMKEMIEEEKRLKELRRKMEDRQREKRRMARQRRKEKKEKEGGEIVGEKESDGGTTESDKINSWEEFGTENSSKSWKTEQEEQEKSEILGKSLPEEITTQQLISLISDDILYSEYFKFLADPSDPARHILLDLAVFVNELWHRMEVLGKFSGICSIGVGEIFEIGERWKELMEEGEVKIRNGAELEQMEQKLHELLKGTVLLTERIRYNSGDTDAMMVRYYRDEHQDTNRDDTLSWRKEINTVRNQLHTHKLAKAIIVKEREENIWPKLGQNGQVLVLTELFRMGEKTNVANRFNRYLANWWQMVEQQSMDQKICENYREENFDLEILVDILENTQQIYFLGTEEQTMETMLNELLTKNGYGNSNSAKSAFNALKRIISEWSDGEARLLETGSFLLGTHAPNSDIDTICILPQRTTLWEEKNRFFGKEYCILYEKEHGEKQRICEDNSLYCHLCKNSDTASVRRLPRALIPLIKLRFAGHDFDIAFVCIPDLAQLPDEPLDSVDVGWMMELLASPAAQIAPSDAESMLKALAGYTANSQMVELLKDRYKKKIRSYLLFLKFWAKSNYIYGSVFGFFNGASLAILTTKIILWYPNGSLAFLFDKFLLIFANIWKWPMPVKLGENPETRFVSLIENNGSKDQQSPPLMPIITPGKLAQNAGNNINQSTFKVIQYTMKRAHDKLKMLRGSSNSLDMQQWATNMFPTEHFIDKYANFVISYCIVGVPQHIGQFCGFVERKMRVHWSEFDEIMGRVVEYSHLRPDNWRNGPNWQCPAQIVRDPRNSQFRTPLCKMWLIGLRMRGEDQDLSGELRKEMEEKLEKEIDTKIFEEYEVRVMRGWYTQLRLESRLLDRDELLREEGEWYSEQKMGGERNQIN